MTIQEAYGILADAEVENRNLITQVINRGGILRMAYNAAIVGRDYELSSKFEDLIVRNGRVLSVLMAD